MPASASFRTARRLVPAACVAAAFACLLAPSSAAAAPGDADARKGLAFARKGQCVEAMPLLESAEAARHRPETAVALADCYVALGALMNAKALYEVVSVESPDRSFTRADHNALARAKKKLKEVDARIPTIAFKFPADYKNPSVTANGEAIENPSEPRSFDPGEDIVFVISALGRKPRKETISLAEKERRVFSVDLAPDAPTPKATTAPRFFLGAAYRGYVIPTFVMNIFGDGGRTVAAPGGGVFFSRSIGRIDISFGLDYAAFYLPATPFKPSGTPDTEYEIVRSDLSSLQAFADVRYNIPLDAKKRFSFRIGAGLGVGWTFAGNLYRTQAFPPFLQPGDPYTYLPCAGPNNPGGSYRYCNELDKDADHYGDFAEPSWFAGGSRPLVYPWIALPIVGLSFRATERVLLDLDVAPSIAGLFTSAGVRVGF